VAFFYNTLNSQLKFGCTQHYALGISLKTALLESKYTKVSAKYFLLIID